ncbi:MAG: ParA family protein, partial [Agitococcus sp.]|nr:ParA family protein [Agitococcus sp.]
TLPMQLVAELKEEGLPIMQTYLASSVIMKESHQKSMPLVFLAPQHKLSEQYMALFDELADD